MISKMYNKQNFGFTDKIFSNYKDVYLNLENYKEHFVAIPYNANNLPAYGSEFSDFELAVSLTMLSYLYSRIRVIDIYIFLMDITQKINIVFCVGRYCGNRRTNAVTHIFC